MGKHSFDLGGLVGIRTATGSCPESYVGFQCYTDITPEIGYKINYGSIGIYRFEKIMLALRFTGVSGSVIFGLKF